MSISNHIEKTRLNSNNQKELRNLRENHKLQLEKMELQHQKRKDQARVNNQLSLSSLHSDHERKLAQKVQRNEETYQKLQDSLQEVKDNTAKAKAQIQKDLESQSIQKKTTFETQMQDRTLQQKLTLEDLEHQGRLELERLNYETKAKISDVEQQKIRDVASIKQDSLQQQEIDKEKYAKEQLVRNEKYYYALQNQQKAHTKQVANKDRQHQTILKNRDKQFHNEIETIKNDQKVKKDQLQTDFEKSYQKNFERNNELMKTLIGKKEKMINYVRGLVRTEASKELEMANDSFYQMVDLKPKVQENENKDGYIVTIEVPKYEVKQVKLTAYDRELKVTLDRNFDHNRVDVDGSKDTIKRSESFITKVPVEDIVDSKSIKKSYSDGVLRYEIAKA